jgi:predicted nucleotidyltransferase
MDNKHKILLYLGKNPFENPTMHSLSEKLSIPYASFYRTLKSMKDLLVIQEVGKAKVVGIDWSKEVAAAYLATASYEEKKDFLRQSPLIKMISQDLTTKDIVLLFGSYAKKVETERSDIDLLIINRKGNRSVSFSKFELLFRKEINPIFVTFKEFKLMLLDEEENVGKQALYHHILLNNPIDFWKSVSYAIQKRKIPRVV